MADANLGDLVTTTLRNRRGQLADNILNHNAVLRFLNRAGNVDPADGGRTLVEELGIRREPDLRVLFGLRGARHLAVGRLRLRRVRVEAGRRRGLGLGRGGAQERGQGAVAPPRRPAHQERREDDDEHPVGGRLFRRHWRVGQADRGPARAGRRRPDDRDGGRHRPRLVRVLAQPGLRLLGGLRRSGRGHHPEGDERALARLPAGRRRADPDRRRHGVLQPLLAVAAGDPADLVRGGTRAPGSARSSSTGRAGRRR